MAFRPATASVTSTTQLALRVAGSDRSPRSHVPWNGSRRADNPDTLQCQVSTSSLQAPIRLLESTIPLAGPVVLSGPPRFITAEASEVRLRDTHVPSLYGQREPPGLSLPGAVRGSRSRTSGAVLHASTRCRSRRPFRSHGPLLLFAAPGRCFGTVSFLTQSRLWTCCGLHVTPVGPVSKRYSFKAPTAPPSLSILGSFVR